MKNNNIEQVIRKKDFGNIIMVCELCNFEESEDNFPELESENGRKIYNEKVPDLTRYSQLFQLAEKKGLFIIGTSQYICPNCGACWIYDSQ
jgi:hypothetical protein